MLSGARQVPPAVRRAGRAIPRTWHFARSLERLGDDLRPFRAPAPSLSLLAQVAMDEVAMAATLSPRRLPGGAELDRAAAELLAARELFTARGWLADPASYHRSPPALEASDLSWRSGRALGLSYLQMRFESLFDPRPEEPGAERWRSYGANRTAAATLVRHLGAERPWVICVHGFSMGYPFMDFAGLQTARLHRHLGLNVALPVLPLHGPRKATPLSGDAFLSFEMMNSVHALAQSVWDIRRILSFLRGQGAAVIGLYGVSLGAYVAALLAGLEEGLASVVSGIPVVDLPALFSAHSPSPLRRRAERHGMLSSGAEAAHHVVSPLAFAPRVPRAKRFIFAGYGDRMAFPHQARRLWEHWEEPAICWYPGSHVGYLWSGQVARFLDDSLRSALLHADAPAG